jgi:hybrid polyketide synthase/nonribosomal peptide synthetase ACE1
MVRLRRMLALGPEETIDERMTFVEQGIDSLMAVDVRSWLLKELDVDIPVLKILGGNSIADLLEHAIDQVPQSIVDLTILKTGSVPLQSGSIRKGPAERDADSVGTDIEEPLSTSKEVTVESGRSSVGSETPPTSANDSTTASVVNFPDEKLDPQTNTPAPVISPMSFGQTGFWFLNTYLAHKSVLNMGVLLKINGNINADALGEAVRLVCNRHEMFRTRFSRNDDEEGGRPVQKISADSALLFTTKSISGEPEAFRELENLRQEDWDLSHGYTAKIMLLSASEKVHYIITGMHHILMDGYSLSIMFKDLDEAYRRGTLAKLDSRSQYRSFARKQLEARDSGSLVQSIEHYRRALPPAAELQPIALLPLARRGTRQDLNTYKQHETVIQIPGELVTKVRQLARSVKSTSFHVYLGAIRALLFKLLSETQELFIGIADANRADKDFMGSVGFFLNLLPLHFVRDDAKGTVSSTIKEARDRAYAALSHSHLPFDVLLRELNIGRSSKHTPLFQVFVDYKQVHQDRSSWCGCDLEHETWRLAETGYDIALEITENTGDAVLRLRLQEALYSQESTDLLLRSYVSVLEYMVQNAEGAISGVPAWSKLDLQAVISTGKGTPLEPQWQSTIVHRVEDMIKAFPAKVALKDDNGCVASYKEMGDWVDTIASNLIEAGVAKGDVVGVFQDPSAGWISSLLAILKVGAVYVPLDLRNSTARLRSIVAITQPLLILTDANTTSQLHSIDAGYIQAVDIYNLADRPVLQTRSLAGASDAAIILFTSGSTGEPKGIVMTHGNIVANAEANSRIYASTTDEHQTLAVLQQSAFSFDFSLDQIFAALANGGLLYVVGASHRGDPEAISKIMDREKITYTSSTPSEYEMWLRYSSTSLKLCKSWRYAFSGGESMNQTLPSSFAALALANLRLYTGYDYTGQQLPNPLPAGRMLPGYTVCIVDESMRPVPAGVQGEIVIGGPCVVSGYYGTATNDSNNLKFVKDVFFESGTKVYRTGDRGRLLENGLLYCDGRLEGDMQIKLRGFRVELLEVETTIVRHAAGALLQAVVTLRGDGEGRYLAAHLVFAPSYSKDDCGRILQHLRLTLPVPSYMQPAVYTVIDDVPRTAHLKIDRKAVQLLPIHSPTASEEVLPRSYSDTEQYLVETWRNILPLDPGPLGPESDFFAVGGNSMLLVRLQTDIQQRLQIAIRLVTLMGAHTLGSMAAAIEASQLETVVDWDLETSLSTRATELPKAMPTKPTTDSLTILLTGSQGYLGGGLLKRIFMSSQVSRIYCLVRTIPEADRRTEEKVQYIRSDLSKPQLGLSHEDYGHLAESVDVIIHCAANRNFFDHYQVLRPDNVTSVKELVQFAARRSMPFHFLSSGAVSQYDGKEKNPPVDGSDGYTSSKWVAEQILTQAASSMDLSVMIHRPVQAAPDTVDGASERLGLLDELSRIAVEEGVRPAFDGTQGSVHFVPIANVVEAIFQAVVTSTNPHSDPTGSDPEILPHKATIQVSVQDFEKLIMEDAQLQSLPQLPVLQWFGRAKKAGLSYLMTSWDLTIGSGQETLSSRR